MERKKRFIFDIDGTLLASDFSFEERYFRSVLSNDDANILLSMITEILDEYEKSHTRYDIKDLSRFISIRSGIDISPQIIEGWDLAFRSIDSVLIEGAMDAVSYLKDQGYSLAILTNWFLTSQIQRLENSGFLQYFDDIYGGEIGIKPNKESFELACGRFPKEECVVIGNSYIMDIKGSTDALIDAIYYNPRNKEFEMPQRGKVKSIGSMKMIKEMF